MTSTKVSRPPTIEPAESPILRELSTVRNRLRHLFDEPFAKLLPEPLGVEALSSAFGWMPLVEASETPKEYLITAELPGLKLEDVSVEAEGDIITIRGKKEEEKKTEEKRYHLWERSYGSFQRTFTLPLPIVADDIHAEMKNGVLSVHVPKSAEAKSNARKIAISEKK
ncbi:MAG: Hsp20/alpha crystallin family protein [Gemmatimonadetes bacterium]|nr:Hsp20/alpha crystallin family protein [Gemmatimonadota bacterium]